MPPELLDGIKGVGLAKRGAPGGALLGFRLVVEPERPSSLQLVRLLWFRGRRGHFRLGRHVKPLIVDSRDGVVEGGDSDRGPDVINPNSDATVLMSSSRRHAVGCNSQEMTNNG